MNLTTLNGEAEFATPRPPVLSKEMALGAFKLGIWVFLPTMTGLMVTVGVGLPEAARSAAANSTIVNGALALLDQRLPAASKISAHGPWMEF